MAVFNEKELEIIGQYNMPGIYGAPDSIVPKHNYPITPKENMLRMLRGEMPLWVPNQTLDNKRHSARHHARRPRPQPRRQGLVLASSGSMSP